MTTTTPQPASTQKPTQTGTKSYKKRIGFGPASIPFGLWGVAVAVLVIAPVVVLAVESIRGGDGSALDTYRDVLTDSSLIEATRNSFLIAFGTCAGVLLVAVPLAWLCSRTDMLGRRLIRTTAVLTFAAPSFIAAMGWILLAGPRSGLLNQPLQALFGLDRGPINVFTPGAIVVVLVLFLYPLVFLPTVAAFDGMEAPLEHAASSLGASRWEVLKDVTIPLVAPSIAAGLLVTFTTSFVIFGPVALLGSPNGFETIPIALYRMISFPPRFEAAAVIAIPTIVILGGLLWLQRRMFAGRSFAVVAGKPGQREVIRLGKWKWPAAVFGGFIFLVSLVLPFGVLLLTAFRKAIGLPLSVENLVLTDNFEAVLNHPQVLSSFRNSFVLSLGAVVIASVIALLAAWLVERARPKGVGVVPLAMSLPMALPGAVLGIAVILTFGRQPIGLGGTLLILGVAYVIRALPLAFQYTQAGFKQVSPDLEEAARSLGAGGLKTAWTVTAPLLRGSLIAAALLNFVVLFRELETSIFLYTGSNETIAVVLFDLASDSRFQQMGAFAVVVLTVNLVIALFSQRVNKGRHQT